MNFFQIKKLIVALLLLVHSVATFAFNTTQKAQNNTSIEPTTKVTPLVDSIFAPTVQSNKYIGTAQASEQSFEWNGKLVKEVFADHGMNYLNNANPLDRSFRLRTTADAVFLAAYGNNKKNPFVDAKMALRLRYDVGSPALVKTAAGSTTIAGTTQATSPASIQKTIFWLRELFLRVSLDQQLEGSKHFVKFGSFPYELGRGISLGSAYNSNGFLNLNPRFSIDQFAPGGLLYTDIVPGTLHGELYYAILNNPNSSLSENSEKIRTNQIRTFESDVRGLNTQAWITSGALKWKAINLGSLKLNVDPYAYMYISPDQKLEFPADSNSQLYAIGTALEFKQGKFEWGLETAFQGGHTNVKAWDRNYTNLVNDNGVATIVYTKVYQGNTTTPAIVDNTNKDYVTASEKSYTQNGQEIGGSGLWNAVDRFRPEQKIFYHGYFFVTDMSYELIEKQLRLCFDTGFVSGQLDDYEDVNSMNQSQLMNQQFNGFVPIQSVYSGKRIQHLVMLNTGVPRFVVQYPQLTTKELNVQSRVMGDATLTDKFTNLAYTGIAFEYTPKKFADQKALIKPAAFYYWMVDAPTLLPTGTTVSTLDAATFTPASHALGAAVSITFEATIKECLNMGGYFGWMIPGKQYKEFAGLQLKGGKLGSDVAYVLNLAMTYKF